MKNIRRSLALLILALFLASLPIGAEEKHTYYSGYFGSPSRDARFQARTYFLNPRIQELIREIGDQGSASLEHVQQALAGTGFSVDDLLTVKLLRREGNEFHINFNFFTAEDMRKVATAVDRYAPLLVQAFQAKGVEFDRIFDRYPVKSVDRRKLAFVLVAGFSLNWDGLMILSRDGYRKSVMAEGDGWRYSFWATETPADHDTHGFYWGSSTFPCVGANLPKDPVDYSFSSFGDPYSDPRMNFPDLFLLEQANLAESVRKAVQAVGTVHETALGFDCPDVLGVERVRDVGAILFALRRGPKTEAELAALCSIKGLGPLLSLLEEIQYVEKDQRRRYQLLVPVLDEEDRPIVEAGLALSARVIEQWLTDCYPRLRRDLGSLTSMQQGVPFESLFTQIWHEFFGRTARDLVRTGLLFDPAGPGVKYKLSYPVLWRASLYHFELD
jgi:hypothetical protein